jgi:hypothetical protein
LRVIWFSSEIGNLFVVELDLTLSNKRLASEKKILITKIKDQSLQLL